jgi:hypothetical protein
MQRRFDWEISETILTTGSAEAARHHRRPNQLRQESRPGRHALQTAEFRVFVKVIRKVFDMLLIGKPLPHALILATLVAAAGCGGSVSPTAPAARGPSAALGAIVDGVQPTLYVSHRTAVNLYSATGNPTELGTIPSPGFPFGLYVNKSGDLYVADAEAAKVRVYHRGTRLPFETLDDSNEYPFGVTEDSHETVFVANGASKTGAGDIAVYPHGKTTASMTFTDPKWFGAFAITTDAKDNLYVCFQNETSSGVDKFEAGTTKPIDLKLKPNACGGVVIDKNQNLVVAGAQANHVDVFPPGATRPSNTFPVPGGPVALTLSTDSKHIFVSHAADDNVSEYTYPDGSVVETINIHGESGSTDGLAVDPPAEK